MSNKWLVDIVGTDFVARHAAPRQPLRLPAAANRGDRALSATQKLVRTTHGLVEYDYLILSGGIRDAWDAWFGDDQRAIEHTRRHYASAYIPNQQMFGLKQRVKDSRRAASLVDAAATARTAAHPRPTSAPA